MSLFWLWTLSKKIRGFGCSWVGGGRVGGGDPPGKLSGLGGPPPLCTMLIVTGTLLQPKKATIAGGLGAKLGALRKKPFAS